jgi:hypothetical protein
LRFGTDGLPDRALAVLELQTFGGHVVDAAPAVDGKVTAVGAQQQ